MCRRWYRSLIALLLFFVSHLCYALPRPELIKSPASTELDTSPDAPAPEAVQPHSASISASISTNASISTMSSNTPSTMSSSSSSSPPPPTFTLSSSSTLMTTTAMTSVGPAVIPTSSLSSESSTMALSQSTSLSAPPSPSSTSSVAPTLTPSTKSDILPTIPPANAYVVTMSNSSTTSDVQPTSTSSANPNDEPFAEPIVHSTTSETPTTTSTQPSQPLNTFSYPPVAPHSSSIPQSSSKSSSADKTSQIILPSVRFSAAATAIAPTAASQGVKPMEPTQSLASLQAHYYDKIIASLSAHPPSSTGSAYATGSLYPSSGKSWTGSFNSSTFNSSFTASPLSTKSSSSSSAPSSSSPPVTNGTLSQCQPSSTSCNFYTCIENLYHCGSKGYPMAYGDEYCTRYTDNYHEFSSEGQAFVGKSRQCVQQKLADALSSSNGQMSCSKLSSTAYASQADCYVQSGFCDLQVGDLGWIAYTVGPSYFTSLSTGVESAMSSLNAVTQCSGKWEAAVKGVLKTLAHGFGNTT